MISLLIYIKHRFSWLWSIIEWLNGWLFAMIYPKFFDCVHEVLSGFHNEKISPSIITHGDIAGLEKLWENQSAQYLSYFEPHPFDAKTLNRLLKNKSFAMMKMTDNTSGRIIGYFFLRCFFTGKAFHGLMVDEHYNNYGIGMTMWALSAQICNKARMKMFATVSEHNIASITSARKATEVTVVDKLANDYLLIECRPKAK